MKAPELPPSVTLDAPILTLIQGLKDGSVHASTLTKEQRLACVEVLYLEGYSLSQIAQVVERSEKTIGRDLVDIRTRNALTPSLELAKQLIGNLLMKSEAHQARLMRLARATDGAIADRAQAEYLAWRVAKETTELLQSLGYLPQQPQEVVGNMAHYFGGEEGESSLAHTETTIAQIETIARETGTLTPELTVKLEALRQQVDHAKLHQTAQQLLNTCQNPPTTQETPDAQPPQ